MTSLELLFLSLPMLKGIGIALILITVVLFMVSVALGKNALLKNLFKYSLMVVFGITLLFSPTAQDLWEIRISMIKFYLASPENLQKGVDTIERLGKKLECKYLGCKEEK